MEDLVDPDAEQILSYLRALAELALSAPSAFEERSDEIIRFVMENVMLRKSISSDVRFIRTEGAAHSHFSVRTRQPMNGLRRQNSRSSTERSSLV